MIFWNQVGGFGIELGYLGILGIIRMEFNLLKLELSGFIGIEMEFLRLNWNFWIKLESDLFYRLICLDSPEPK